MKSKDRRGRRIFPTSRIVFCTAVAVVGTSTILAVVQCSSAQTSKSVPKDQDKATFFAIIDKMLETGDLLDYGKIGAILGVHFSEIRFPKVLYLVAQGLEPQTGTSPPWLAGVSYTMLGVPPGSARQIITLIVRAPLCVTPDDIRTRFGVPTLPSNDMPASPTFIDKKSWNEYLNEVNTGPGISSMNYRYPRDSRTTLSFYFRMLKCMQDYSMSIVP